MPNVTSDARTFKGASRLASIVGWAPERREKSSDIDATLRSHLGLEVGIERATGVKEVRAVEEGESIADMATRVGVEALRRAGVKASEVDAIIYCGVCREYAEPATATVIHARLGLTGATAFDISNACLGFLDGWIVADSLVAARRCRAALVITAEQGSTYRRLALERIIAGEKPQTHLASLTLGDGAAAAVLVPRAEEEGAPGLVAGLRESHGEHHGLCVIPRLGEPMQSSPGRLLELGLRYLRSHADRVLKVAEWSPEDLDVVVPHQVSGGAIERGRKILGLLPNQVANTLQQFGNMASAAVPFALARAVEERDLQPGARVLVAGFGSGLGIATFAVRM